MKRIDIISSAVLGFVIGVLLPFIAWRIGKTIPLGGYLFIIFPVLSPLGLWVASLLAKKLRVLFQIGKFGIVGTANFVVDVGALHAIILLSGNEKPSDLFGVLGLTITSWTLFKALSFIIANSHSFFWNKFWTFDEHDMGKTKMEYAQFFTVSIIGLFINGIAFSFVFALRPELSSEAVWGTLGAAAGAVAGLAWNFLGYKFFVFKK